MGCGKFVCTLRRFFPPTSLHQPLNIPAKHSMAFEQEVERGVPTIAKVVPSLFDLFFENL